MRRLFFLVITVLLLVSFTGTGMGFTVTVYTDKTEWENALTGLSFNLNP